LQYCAPILVPTALAFVTFSAAAWPFGVGGERR
jgi:hypothetical protein